MDNVLKRVLIVTPNWPPVSCPDLHRVRMALPYFARFGWEPLILKIDPLEQEGIKDPTLLSSLPPDVRTWQAGCVPRWLTSGLGLRNVGSRSLVHLWRLGSAIIRQEKPDLVFFSTTMFQVTILGPIWKRRFGIPYVMDFQDPWYAGYYQTSRNRRPGGKLKHSLTRGLARVLERWVMRHVSQVIVVSTAYTEALGRHYKWLESRQFTTLPFGAPERDFELLNELQIQQHIFDKSDGKRHVVYVGRGGADMVPALRILFEECRRSRMHHPDRWINVRLHFVGTSYAPHGRAQETVKPLADEYGLDGMVEERTDRVPYFEALQVLREADGLLVIGSDSSSYTPSKVYPYLLARRPLLAILNERTGAAEMLRRCAAANLVTLTPAAGLAASMEIQLGEFLTQIENDSAPNLDWLEFAQYTAREMTRRLCEVFDKALAREH